jgi:hypothetical protein
MPEALPRTAVRTIHAEHAALQNHFPELTWNNYASWTAHFVLNYEPHLLHVWQHTNTQVGYAVSSLRPIREIAYALIVDSFENALPLVRTFYDELTRRR